MTYKKYLGPKQNIMKSSLIVEKQRGNKISLGLPTKFGYENIFSDRKKK